MTPVLSRVRAEAAIYNENIRGVAARHDAVVADLWAMRELRDPRMWAPDRLCFSPLGHHTIGRQALAILNVPNHLEPLVPEPTHPISWRQARVDDIGWAKDSLVP